MNNFFKIKKLTKIFKNLKNSEANTWHVRFKNFNYLNTISKKTKNLTKIKIQLNTTKIETKCIFKPF